MFHEQLAKARKAARMTQEQLAEKMHVSRQTVSHWENGRAAPDEETLQKLREVLPFEAEPAQRNRLPGWLWLLVLGAACALLLVGVKTALPVLAPAPTATPYVEPTASPAPTAEPLRAAEYPLDWYRSEDASSIAAVKPLLTPVMMAQTDFFDEPAWRVQFDIATKDGTPFTLEKITIATFNDKGEPHHREVHAARDIYPDCTISAENPLTFSSLWPQTPVRWYCLAAEGRDAQGNAVAAGGVIELLNEVEKTPELSEFLAGQEKVSGKAHMVLSYDVGESARLTRGGDPYSGDDAWVYTNVFTNTGDAAFTVAQIEYVSFNGETFVMKSVYPGEVVAGWCNQPDAVFDVGEVWELESFCPLQDVTAECVRFTGTDASGEEMVFTGRLEFIREYSEP